MDDEQRQFLQTRLQLLTAKQPAIADLRQRLLAIQGVELVAPSVPDRDLDEILHIGALSVRESFFEEYEANSCHENAAALFLQGSTDGIGTGYALSDDGLWRQHSWGLRMANLVETTELRTLYFGIELRGPAAKNFALSFFSE